MDAFVFVRARLGQAKIVAEEIARLPVRQVAVLAGDWDVGVAVEAEGPVDLGNLVIEQIQRVSGVEETYTAPMLASAFPLPLPWRGLDAAITTLVFVELETAEESLADDLQRIGGVASGALLAGDYDLVVEVAGNSWEEVSSALVELRSIPGALSTPTSVLVSDKYKSGEPGTT
jgi:DNA-binding Lrp family transcriptional regulator